jgi:hypothetical protein
MDSSAKERRKEAFLAPALLLNLHLLLLARVRADKT